MLTISFALVLVGITQPSRTLSAVSAATATNTNQNHDEVSSMYKHQEDATFTYNEEGGDDNVPHNTPLLKKKIKKYRGWVMVHTLKAGGTWTE
jgi:hypothetical protein